MRELAPLRDYGLGVPEAEVLATREDEENPLRLPPLEILAPYAFATAERRAARAPVEVRLWMSERDADAYLERRRLAGGLLAASVFRILPATPVEP